MHTTTHKKKRLSPNDKENAKVIKCLQRRLAWCNKTGNSFSPEKEQYSLYPRALADENGLPHKSAKSQWTEKLQKRYDKTLPAVFSNQLLIEWLPQTVIIDAMFVINTKPLRNTQRQSVRYSVIFTLNWHCLL
jgi:hypothetical protein